MVHDRRRDPRAASVEHHIFVTRFYLKCTPPTPNPPPSYFGQAGGGRADKNEYEQQSSPWRTNSYIWRRPGIKESQISSDTVTFFSKHTTLENKVLAMF